MLIRGGFSSGGKAQGSSTEYHVPIVNVVQWMMDNFRESDFVVVKMDVEGAEHGILSGLLDHGKLGIIDILAFECHAAKTSTACKDLNKRLDQAAVASKTKILREASGYQGWDRFSTPDKYYPLDPKEKLRVPGKVGCFLDCNYLPSASPLRNKPQPPPPRVGLT